MGEQNRPGSFEEFDSRLGRLRAEVERRGGEALPGPTTGPGMAFAIASHMVAGLLVGGGLGYWLDRWLGTKPWLLVVFFFLGAAAGGMNIYRTVRRLGMAAGYRPAPGEDRTPSAEPPSGAGGDKRNGGDRGQSA
jgi:ATP synthase protein I